MARINERFDESPKLIDQAAQATRALDDIIADMDRKLAKKGLAKNLAEAFQQARKDAVAAKSVVEDALLRPLEDMRKASERRLQVQDLIAQGHDIEAAALQNVWSIEDKLGSEEQLRAKVQALITAGRKEEAAAFEQLLAKYPQMKREAAELAEQEAQRTREAERQKALFDAQLNVIQTARGGLRTRKHSLACPALRLARGAQRRCENAMSTEALQPPDALRGPFPATRGIPDESGRIGGCIVLPVQPRRRGAPTPR